jgi:DNA-binding SARP family transcriptional activator
MLQGFRPARIPEFEAWLEVERQALHNDYREAVFRFATELEAKERYLDAAGVMAELHERDPFDEEAIQRQLALLDLGGERGKALEAFKSFSEMLERKPTLSTSF